MRVAYEHIRFVPNNEIAKEIAEGYVEDEIANTDHGTIKKIDQMSVNTKYDLYEEIFGHDRDPEDMEELRQFGAVSSLFNSNVVGTPEKDIGLDTTKHKDASEISGKNLESTYHQILNDIYQVVGSKQMTRSKAACAPPWIL